MHTDISNVVQGPDTDPDTVRRMAIALQEGNEVEEVILNYTKDGYKFWNLLSLTPLRLESGKLFYLGLQKDVTHTIDKRMADEFMQKPGMVLSQSVSPHRNDALAPTLPQKEPMRLEHLTNQMTPDSREVLRSLDSQKLHFVISDLSQSGQPIVYTSEAFLVLTGYTLDEVLGGNCNFLQALSSL